MTAYDPLQVVTYYQALFAGRHDAYSPHTGDHWIAVREPLTPEVVLDALRGRSPIAGYFLAPDCHTHVAALDFDTEDGWAQAMLVGRTLRDHGMPTAIERSRRGAHLWLVLADRQPAVLIRRALRGALQLAGIAPDPKIEIRPGQDRIADGQLGSALRLPTMRHQTTGKRYPLCDPETGEPLGASLSAMLLELELAPSGPLTALAEAYVPPLDPRALDDQDRAPRARTSGADAESASEILATLYGVPNARPGKAVKCPVHDDRHPSLSILPDDRRVICHSPVCELHNDGRGRGTFELRRLAAARVA